MRAPAAQAPQRSLYEMRIIRLRNGPENQRQRTVAYLKTYVSMAKAAGADCLVTACPLCQLNLDLRQRDVEAKFGGEYNLPVFYFTQLLGLAMGCSAEELSLGSLIVEPQALLESVKACA